MAHTKKPHKSANSTFCHGLSAKRTKSQASIVVAAVASQATILLQLFLAAVAPVNHHKNY
jgi:hypothetical protein